MRVLLSCAAVAMLGPACVGQPASHLARDVHREAALGATSASMPPVAFRLPQAIHGAPANSVCPQVATDAANQIYEAGERAIAQLSPAGVVRWVYPLDEETHLVAVANSMAGSGTAALVVKDGRPSILRVDATGRWSWTAQITRVGVPAAASLVMMDRSGGVAAVLSYEHRVVLRAFDGAGRPVFAREWDDANEARISRTPSGKTFVIARRDAAKAYVPDTPGAIVGVPRRESEAITLAAISASGEAQWQYRWRVTAATMDVVAFDDSTSVAVSASWIDRPPGSPLVSGRKLFLPTLLELVVYPHEPKLDILTYLKGANSRDVSAARIDAMAVGCDDFMWIEGTMERRFTFGPYATLNPRLGHDEDKVDPAACGRFLAIRSPDGEPVWVHELATALPCDARTESMAVLPGGGVVLTVTHRGPLALDVAGPAPEAGDGERCTILEFPTVPPPATARPDEAPRLAPGRCILWRTPEDASRDTR